MVREERKSDRKTEEERGNQARKVKCRSLNNHINLFSRFGKYPHSFLAENWCIMKQLIRKHSLMEMSLYQR
jgi:hypothetical protein